MASATAVPMSESGHGQADLPVTLGTDVGHWADVAQPQKLLATAVARRTNLRETLLLRRIILD